MSGNRDTGTLGHWVMHRPSPCWCYAKLLQSCPTLCNPIDGSPPGSPVPGILQARTLEWVAISFFNAWKWKVKVKSLSCVRLLAIPWTVAYQAPPSMGLSRQEYWSGVPLPSPLLWLVGLRNIKFNLNFNWIEIAEYVQWQSSHTSWSLYNSYPHRNLTKSYWIDWTKPR